MIPRSLKIQLILHEGLRNKPYKRPGGSWIIGVGRDLDMVGLSNKEQDLIFGESGLSKEEILKRFRQQKITNGQAFYLLQNDIDSCRKELEGFAWFLELSPVRQKVLIDMCFNLGLSGIGHFEKMLVALENKDYKLAALEMKGTDWYHQGGLRAKTLYEMMLSGRDYD